MLVEVDAEVGGEDEGPATVLRALLLLHFVHDEVGAHEPGGGAVEGEVTAVGGVMEGEACGRGGGEVRSAAAGPGRSVARGACAVGSGTGGEEKGQPVEDAADRVGHVDAPSKR